MTGEIKKKLKNVQIIFTNFLKTRLRNPWKSPKVPKGSAERGLKTTTLKDYVT